MLEGLLTTLASSVLDYALTGLIPPRKLPAGKVREQQLILAGHLALPISWVSTGTR